MSATLWPGIWGHPQGILTAHGALNPRRSGKVLQLLPIAS